MSDINKADLLNYFQKEATHGAAAAQARDWLLKITSLDNATAESQARLAQTLKDEAAAKDRLAQIVQAQQEAAAQADADKRAAAEELQGMQAVVQAQIAAVRDEAKDIGEDAVARAAKILAVAGERADKIKADMIDSLSGMKDDIAQATTERDRIIAQADAAKARLDEYNAAKSALLAR